MPAAAHINRKSARICLTKPAADNIIGVFQAVSAGDSGAEPDRAGRMRRLMSRRFFVQKVKKLDASEGSTRNERNSNDHSFQRRKHELQRAASLFKHVDLKFVPGNCYGIIGANGAGKSTFLRILSGDLEPTTGEVIIPKRSARMSILKQDHFQYDAYTVLDTVIMGNQHLYDIMKEKDALYEKEDFTDEDGVLRQRAGGGVCRAGRLGGGIRRFQSDPPGAGPVRTSITTSAMADADPPSEKVKVLLAQALFGKPDIIMLDEPTNNLDIEAIEWLEDFLLDFEGTGHCGQPRPATSSTPSAPTSWTSTTARSRCTWATTTSGMNPASWCSG